MTFFESSSCPTSLVEHDPRLREGKPFPTCLRPPKHQPSHHAVPGLRAGGKPVSTPAFARAGFFGIMLQVGNKSLKHSPSYRVK
jgi:hypothetical protein